MCFYRTVEDGPSMEVISMERVTKDQVNDKISCESVMKLETIHSTFECLKNHIMKVTSKYFHMTRISFKFNWISVWYSF